MKSTGIRLHKETTQGKWILGNEAVPLGGCFGQDLASLTEELATRVSISC